MKRTAFLLLCLTLAACATPGPRRQSVSESLAGAEHAPPSGDPEAARQPAASSAQAAGPFSAGLMLGAGISTQDGRFHPLQLAAAKLKLTSIGPRSVDVLALGGVSTSIPQDGEATPRIRGAWGVGAGFELTNGALLYEVSAGLGVLWMTGITGPVIAGGVTISPKM